MTLEQKVDRILLLLEGDGKDAPGLMKRVTMLESLVYGEGQNPGLRTKVLIMYRFYIWILCTASAAVGSLGTLVIKHML